MLTPEPTKVGRFEEHRLPNGEVVYFDADAHRYYGEIKPNAKSPGGYSYVRSSALTGVSTAAKFLDGDPTGLMHWAAQRDQDGVARIASADLDAGRSLDWLRSQESIAERLAEAEATWTHERDRRADQGTNVHKETVWKLATGQDANLADLSGAERGYGQAVFRSFQALQPKVRYAEQLTVAHDKWIAGTFDLWAEIEVERFDSVPEQIEDLHVAKVLIDYKTRDASGKIRKSDWVQTEGYEDCNLSCGIEGTDARLVIVVLPDGSFEPYWSEATREDWYAAVNACLRGKQIDRRLSKAKREAAKAREAVIA